MTSNKLTILISSPESYRDVFNISAELFLKNWSDCPYFKMYTTDFIDEKSYSKNDKNTQYKGFCVFCFPTAEEFISRTTQALQNITTKYTMLICDDIFLLKKVKNKDFEDLIKFMNTNDMLYCKLNKNSKIAHHKNKIYENVYSILYSQPYGRNLQAAIWDTAFLKQTLLNSSKNVYEIEENWLKETVTKNNTIIDEHCYYHNDYFYHAVYKGKWLRGAEKIVKKQKIQFVTTRPKVSIKTTVLSMFKKIMRNLLSAQSRVKLKRKLSKHFDIDTKY